MKKTIQLICFIMIGSVMGGCMHKGYFVDRGRDALDIFSATIGVGAGAKARVGPLTAGLIVNTNCAGLLGGEIFSSEAFKSDIDGKPLRGGEIIVLAGGDFGNRSELAKSRNKDYEAFVFILTALPGAPDVQPKYNPSYFTQIEVVAGLGGTIRLGFNPGELLDFILGWVTIDIFNDDLEKLKKRNNSKGAQQAGCHVND